VFQQPTNIIGTPPDGVQPYLQNPTNMIQVHPVFATPWSNAACSGPYIPIVPRPAKPPIWRQLPVASSNGTKRIAVKKKAIPFRKRVSSCSTGREHGGITSYGTKLVTALHPNSSNETSVFCRILPEHPSDILIPRTDVHPVDRLPMLQFVERDEYHPVSHPFRKEDVFLGRGGFSNRQCGNLWFRSMVAAYREAYHALPKGGKGQLARNLCNYVRLSGGRFLEQRGHAKQLGCWYECGDERAQAKCSQALRETSILSISDCEEKSLSTSESADGSLDSVEG
jgi:hypothetical protein